MQQPQDSGDPVHHACRTLADFSRNICMSRRGLAHKRDVSVDSMRGAHVLQGLQAPGSCSAVQRMDRCRPCCSRLHVQQIPHSQHRACAQVQASFLRKQGMQGMLQGLQAMAASSHAEKSLYSTQSTGVRP